MIHASQLLYGDSLILKRIFGLNIGQTVNSIHSVQSGGSSWNNFDFINIEIICAQSICNWSTQVRRLIIDSVH
ncbi:hypothetical protein D3C72_1675360 [compost metagenome]